MISNAKASPSLVSSWWRSSARPMHTKERPLVTHPLKVSIDSKPAWWAEVRADGTTKDSDGYPAQMFVAHVKAPTAGLYTHALPQPAQSFVSSTQVSALV